jgi:hypothetical protein
MPLRTSNLLLLQIMVAYVPIASISDRAARRPEAAHRERTREHKRHRQGIGYADIKNWIGGRLAAAVGDRAQT